MVLCAPRPNDIRGTIVNEMSISFCIILIFYFSTQISFPRSHAVNSSSSRRQPPETHQVMNGTELFDLPENYHDALECLFQRDRSIKELEAKLASRDEHIMSLELKLVQMSLELASSKAMEDEHHMYKRMISSASSTSLSLQHTHDETMECRADIGGDKGQPAGGLRRLSSSNVSQSWSAPRSNSWHMSLASQAPLAFIPQAKSETADASAVGGDTDEPKQFVSPILSFCRLPSESTRGSTDSSANPLDTSINVRCLIRTVSTCGTIITDPYPIPNNNNLRN